jgi:hypothetical protein
MCQKKKCKKDQCWRANRHCDGPSNNYKIRVTRQALAPGAAVGRPMALEILSLSDGGSTLRAAREIAELASPQSEIVFQFVLPAAALAGEESSLVTTLAARAAAVGELWLSFFEPEDLKAHLRQMGFRKVFHFGSQQATERYLLDRTDGLRPPAYFRE